MTNQTPKNKNTVRLLSHQEDFVTSLNPKWLGLVGGYRAGKTRALCQKAIYMTFMNPGFHGALLMPTNAMVRRVLIPTMEECLQETGAWKCTRLARSDPKFIIQTSEGPSDILLLSAENYTRAAGLSLAWFGIDEFDLVEPQLAEESWRMMVSRLTRGNHMQGFTTSTPEGFRFLYKFFQEDVEKAENEGKALTDRRLIRARTADNPYITDDYVATLESQYPPHLLKAYLNGEFVAMATGRVYPDFDRAFNHTDLTIKDFLTSPLHIGIDFNVGKMHTTVAVVKNYQPFVIDEIVGEVNTPALCREIQRRYPNRAVYVYPDASGVKRSSSSEDASMSDIVHLRNAGFDVHAKRTNPAVKDRVASVNGQILNGKNDRRLLINPHTCPVLIKSLEQQTYDNNGKPTEANDLDHSIDALGYFIHWNWPISNIISDRKVR